jgi:hypothetical protein
MIDNRAVLLLSFLNFIVISLCLTIILNGKLRESDYKDTIKQIRSSRDSLSKLNLELDKKGQALEEKASALQQKITANNHTIQNLKTKRNEKINQLDTMYAHDLVHFFSDFKTNDPGER